MQAAGLTYGSDPTGLVWGFLFGHGADAQPLGSSEALAWLRARDELDKRSDKLAVDKTAPQDAHEFIWLHFNLSHAASEKWLTGHLKLADEFFDMLHEGSRSTRIELAENTLIAVVNDVLHDFSFNPSDIATLWVSVAPRVFISARRKPLQSIDRLRLAVAGGEAIRSPVELLTHLMRDQGDILLKIVRDAVAKVDEIEDTLLAGRLNPKRASLGAIRRVLVRLQRLLAPEPAALFRLLQRPPAWVDELDTQELRESTEEFSVVLSDMASLQERIKLLQEEIAAGVNEENNRSLFVLTIVTVLALPINIIAGLLGMNVGGVPLSQHPHGFWIVCGVVAVFTLGASWFVIRRQRDH